MSAPPPTAASPLRPLLEELAGSATPLLDELVRRLARESARHLRRAPARPRARTPDDMLAEVVDRVLRRPGLNVTELRAAVRGANATLQVALELGAAAGVLAWLPGPGGSQAWFATAVPASRFWEPQNGLSGAVLAEDPAASAFGAESADER